MPRPRKNSGELSAKALSMRRSRERRALAQTNARATADMAGAYIRYLLAAVERAAAAGNETAKALSSALVRERGVWVSSAESPQPPTTGELIQLGKLARWLDEQAGTTPPSFKTIEDLVKG